MDYQFLEDFKKLSVKCPPENYKPKKMVVFRWIFGNILDERNFQPLAYRNPKRILGFDDTTKCKSFALSFYDTENNAINQFSFQKNNMGEKVYKTMGTHLASANITELDGVNDEANDETGHISHHLLKNHQYEKRFTIISKL